MTPKLTVRQLAQTFQRLWPQLLAESWDAPGFAISRDVAVSKVLLCVDVTPVVLAEAKHRGANLIFSHHPYLMRAGQSPEWDSLKGPVIASAIEAGLSLFAAHTNADVVEDGVSDTLAKALRLQDIRPLVETTPGIGHGRIGRLASPVTLEELVVRLVQVLPFTARGIATSGYPENVINTVALCGGAGDSFISAAFDQAADVYITSDLRHHPTSDASQRHRHGNPMALVDISHWAAESLWLEKAKTVLEAAHSEIEFMVSEVVTDPWSFVINRENDEG